jgi:hypothetical protein
MANGIAFNAPYTPYYKEMVSKILANGSRYVSLSYNKMRTMFESK